MAKSKKTSADTFEVKKAVEAWNLEDISVAVKDRFEANQTIKSFSDFIQAVSEDPEKFCRSSAQYVKDVFEFYGHYEVRDINGEQIRRWKLFDKFRVVYGQERAQNQIYNYVCSFAKNRVNKIVLLHGPNGSAKTSLIASIMAAVEDYSKKPEGTTYTFNWLFSDAGDKEIALGFSSNGENEDYNKETLAYTKPEDITFKLPSCMKDNPILLIPVAERQRFLQSLGVPENNLLYKAELSQKSKEIYNQLLVSYGGDWTRVIRHVQVERFYFSKLFRKGLISIDPCQNRDARSRELTLEKSYRIPRSLAMASMHQPYGDLVDANRGIVEYAEIFKRHPDENKYLLNTAEWGTINLPGFTAQLDCVIFATDNEKTLSLFKRNSDWPSFNGRFVYVKVPYLLQWENEKKTCGLILNEHVKSHVAPHTQNMLALWAILTRLRRSEHKLAKDLTFTEKAYLYDTGQAPPTIPQKLRNALEREMRAVADEYLNSRERLIPIGGGAVDDASYEGRGGASYRDIETIVINTVRKRPYLSPLAFFSTIEDVIKNKSIYEFTKLHEGNNEDSIFEPGFLEPEKILDEVKDFYRNMLRQDLRGAAGLVAEDQYDELFVRYIENVKAWTQQEKVRNATTGKYEAPNEHLMRSIEKKMGIDETEYKERRQALFSKLGAWATRNADKLGNGQKPPYKKLFSDLLDALRRNSDTEQREQLKKIQDSIVKWNTEDWKLVVPEEHAKTVEKTIESMFELGYTEESLKEAVIFLIRTEEE